MTKIQPYLKNTLRKIKIMKIQLSVFLFCGFSYVLLYSFFSHKIMSSLLSWQDYRFHLRLLEILESHPGYTPFFDGHPVPYPVFFHNVVKAVSASFDLEIETGLLLVSCLVSFGFSFLIFLTVSEGSNDNLAGLIGAVLLGVGASFVIFFSETIFFGGAFIFPVHYLIAGFLPSLMGHFFGLSMVYIIMKTTLRKLRYVLFCALLGAIVILSHPLTSVTYLIALVSLFFSSYSTQENIKFRHVGLVVFLSIVISSPWWLTIMPELLARPHLVLLSDAGKTWIELGFVKEIIRYYGFIPIFSVLGAVYLSRLSSTRNFLSLWLFMLFTLLFTRWGARFALELAIPLYMLGAVGISQTIRWAICKKNEWLGARLISLAFVFVVFCDSIRLFDVLCNILTQKLL